MADLISQQIKSVAIENGMKFSSVIPNEFEEIEYLAVEIKKFVTAFFLMDNETFNYSYSHTYNALLGKKTKRKPSGF